MKYGGVRENIRSMTHCLRLSYRTERDMAHHKIKQTKLEAVRVLRRSLRISSPGRISNEEIRRKKAIYYFKTSSVYHR